MRNSLADHAHVPGDVAALAKAQRETPTLSAYIRTDAPDPAIGARWRTALKRSIAQRRRAVSLRPRPEQDAFERAVDALTAALPTDAGTHPGWAIFATGGGDAVVRALDTAPVPSVSWLSGPRVAPALAASGPPDAVIAIVDRTHATLHRLSHGALDFVVRLDEAPVVEPGIHMGSAPRSGFHTGTRGETQVDAASRKLRDARERHAAHVAARIATLVAAEPAVNVVVAGTPQLVAHTVESLPSPIAARTATDTTVRTTSAPAAVIAAATAALDTLVTARQAELVRSLLDAAGSGGHAAAGMVDVIRALELRAVDTVLVSPRLIERHSDALEQMLREAIDERAAIQVARPPIARQLDAKADGIVARLRFPVAATRRSKASGVRGHRIHRRSRATAASGLGR